MIFLLQTSADGDLSLEKFETEEDLLKSIHADLEGVREDYKQKYLKLYCNNDIEWKRLLLPDKQGMMIIRGEELQLAPAEVIKTFKLEKK